MKRLLIPLVTGCAVLVAALVAAGCGGSATGSSSSSGGTSTGSSGKNSSGYGYGGSRSAGSSTTTKAATGGATLAVRTTPLGRILVDSRGMTIYLFKKDTGSVSMCNGSCASFWPPVATKGAPKAGNGIDAAKFGTTTRSDGTTQVTYNRHPLYFYAGDKKPGDTTGQGLNAFGALWYVVSPAGNEIVR